MIGWLREALAESAFASATWVDLVDVSVLGFLIYRGIRLLRGTRAMQSLLGVGLLVVLYLIAVAADLTTVRWVLDNVLVYAVLALLILFQEDIRAALARAGGAMLSRGDLASDAHLLEELVRASFLLAQKQVGALIAIQRVGELSSWIEEGHEVDSRISAEILQSFFHPTSPVHDGAVVITGARIAAAGVFLPISFAKSIPKSYGTRHRAAIGLTEITDALCVLVSEERGTVAVVEAGVVRPVADPNDLRERLQEALGVPGPARADKAIPDA